MGKWKKELDKVLALSQEDAKALEEVKKEFEGVIDAAQTFINTYTKVAPKMGGSISALMDSAEDCSRAAAELMVYEDDYEKAKKAKDKAEMKTLDGKMKPLAQAFDKGKKENRKASEDVNKNTRQLFKLLDGLSSALG